MIVLTINNNIEYCDIHQISQQMDYLCCNNPYCPKCGGSGCQAVKVYPFTFLFEESTFRTIGITLGLEGSSIDPKKLKAILDRFDPDLFIKDVPKEQSISALDAATYYNMLVAFCNEAIFRKEEIVWFCN